MYFKRSVPNKSSMLSVIMLNVIMLSVVMLSVMSSVVGGNTQHNNTQHNDVQHRGLILNTQQEKKLGTTLSIYNKLTSSLR